MSHSPAIYIVGQNIEKAQIHAMQRSKTLVRRIVRVAHGIYFALSSGEKAPKSEQDREVNTLFALYGLRIAHHLLPDAGLTHSTAFFREPNDGRIFLGGAYSYRKVIAQEYGDYAIIQSVISDSRDKESVRVMLNDPDLFTQGRIRDPLGVFFMPVQSREMILLTQFESIKLNQDKLLVKTDIDSLIQELIAKHRGIDPLVHHMQLLAAKSNKTGEYERLLKTILSTLSIKN